MTEQQSISRGELLALTSEIVAAYASNNNLDAEQLPQFLQSVFDRVSALSSDEPEPTELTPAVPIKRSVADDYIVCLEGREKAEDG